MKKIEEEWKVIEEFPIYEISNMGSCRNIKTGMLKNMIRKKPMKNYFMYGFQANHKITRISIGKLVAQAFVPNPNGYAQVAYMDGDTSNFCFTNLEWVNGLIEYYNNAKHGSKCKQYPLDEQLRQLRLNIRLLTGFEKALTEGTVTEFVYAEIMPIYRKIVCLKLRKESDELKEDCLSFLLESLIIDINRGKYISSFYGYTICYIKKFNRIYKEHSAYNDDWVKHNRQDDNDDTPDDYPL
ncbi:NUMOD4 motif [Bacteroidales bacterium Barb4]|nr:NUMOD4 motif [Bacteroidales bacterium Barb4]